MTLMGKLFRPWDLPADDSSLKSDDSNCNSSNKTAGISSEKCDHSSSSSTLSNPKCFSFDERTNAVKTYDYSPTTTMNGNSQFSEKYLGRSEARESDTNLTNKSITDSDNREKLSMDFDLNAAYNNTTTQNQSSPMFLDPTAINELANLSRNELTAMGLLPPDQPSSIKIKRQRPKRFHCPHCQVAFSNNGQLRGHIRIHTGERPFSCEHEGCGKSFTRNEELTRHRRIHSGLRPFPCTYCGKKFGRKDHLKKHTRTHQRPIYSTAAGMIGFGNPFHPFNTPLMSSHSSINEFNSLQSPYALPFVLSVPPPISHFPFSSDLLL